MYDKVLVKVFRSAVVKCAEEIIGTMRRVEGWMRKGREWRGHEVSGAVAEKRRAYDLWLQRKHEIWCYSIIRKIKEKSIEQVMFDAKVNTKEIWSRRLTGNFQNKKRGERNS